MNAIPSTSMAIRYTRMLLIKTGLTEGAVDKLIERIAANASAANGHEHDRGVVKLSSSHYHWQQAQAGVSHRCRGTLKKALSQCGLIPMTDLTVR